LTRNVQNSLTEESRPVVARTKWSEYNMRTLSAFQPVTCASPAY
jgi:hypothetical protein